MDEPPRPPDETDVLFYVLRRKRAVAWLVLLFERLWPALWPPLGIVTLFAIVALLDLPAFLPPWGRVLLLAGFALAALASLAIGLRRLRLPAPTEADRRLERATGLRHRPLEILYDRPALPGSAALWQAHIERARAQIVRLRAGLPHPGLAAIDRHALRILVLVGLLAAIGVAGEQGPARLARALAPRFAPPTIPTTLLLQAWITPPSYTGLAPVFLQPDGGAVTVPAGAHLTVNLSGGSEVPDLLAGKAATPFATLGEASFQADRDLAEGGRLTVRRGGHDLAAWDVTVTANQAPQIRFPEPPGPAGNPRQPQLRLPWQVAHAYGVTGLQAELRLAARPDLPPLVIAIPLPGGAPKQARGARLQDLTPHPWAGLPVIARLVGHDAAGLTGTSEEVRVDIPERRFQHPVARALMALRKGLTLNPADRVHPVQEIERIARLDEIWQDDLAGYLNLEALAALLYRNSDPAAVGDAQARMWELALHLEEGAPERTARQLEQARQALRDALDAEQRGEKVDPAEIDRRMKEVQDALDRHLQALADQAKRDPGAENFDPDSQQMDRRDLDRLAQEMRDAARDGKLDTARDKLAELEKLLDQLERGEAQRSHQTERQKQRAEKRQRGEQQMSAMQDMVRRQAGLLDHADRRADDARLAEPRRPTFPRPGFPPPNTAPPDPARQQADRDADRRVQQALRRALGELMQQHGDLTGQVPPNLGEADSAMRDAGQALADGRDDSAATAEQHAVEALQKGGSQMSQQLSRMFGQQGDEADGDEGDEGQGNQMGEGDQDGDQPGDGQGNGRGDPRGGRRYGNGRPGQPWGNRGMDRRGEDRDPLGRLLQDGSGGLDDSGQTQVPEQMEQARTRAIQDELRRRGADRSRPQPELDYIDRLLRQF